jgi:hypothetical protein
MFKDTLNDDIFFRYVQVSACFDMGIETSMYAQKEC